MTAYKEGERLTREGLLMLVLEEAFKDGSVDETENELLGSQDLPNWFLPMVLVLLIGFAFWVTR